MSIEIASLGNFDYSIFDLSNTEKIVISNMIKYDISSYFITKNIQNNSIEFFFNTSSLNHDNANKLFSHMFDLMEVDYAQHKISDFSVSLLHYSFKFSRKIEQKNQCNEVSWTISCDKINHIKMDLFNFFHKSIFYQELLKKLKKKNQHEKIQKI